MNALYFDRGRKFILGLRPDVPTPQSRGARSVRRRPRRQAALATALRASAARPIPLPSTCASLYSRNRRPRSANRKPCRTRLNSSTGTSGTNALESVGSRRTSSVVPTPREHSPAPNRTCKRERSATCRGQVKRPRTADREENGPSPRCWISTDAGCSREWLAFEVDVTPLSSQKGQNGLR